MDSEHYFTPEPSAPHKRQTFTADLRGRQFHFVTEPSVFSRQRVDRGTRLLVKHLQVQPTDRMLDLGCGYGAVGVVAAALAPHADIALTDINARAVSLARENLLLNGAKNAVALHGDGLQPVAGRQFDLIAFNPPLRAGLTVVHSLLQQAHDHLAPDGRLYLVARTRQGAVRLAAKMRDIFGNVSELAKGGGYRLYLSRRLPGVPH